MSRRLKCEFCKFELNSEHHIYGKNEWNMFREHLLSDHKKELLEKEDFRNLLERSIWEYD